MSLRSILFLVNGLALAAFIAVALLASRRRKAASPANLTPYYDDETLEGPKLERVLGAAVLCSAVLAASLPLYWLLEPARQERMSSDFLADSELRGEERFARQGVLPPSEVLPLECARCHGDTAQGGVATLLLQPDEPGELPQSVQWKAPSLDDALLRFSREEVAQIITYGRPGTPMPSWGLAGGGPLNEQAIDDIVNYLDKIKISPEEAKKRSTAAVDEYMKANPGISLGEAAFSLNCARCHTKGASYGQPGIPGGGGAFGPNLTGGVVQRQFPALNEGISKHIELVTTGSDFQKQYGTQGIGSGRMPGFGSILTPEQINQIVVYERSL
ncbi:MAG TPA: c-type cytochrome [Acidimicrobiia bacterium]|nr:c-type cytochrome [Acidimicrobiia bacterium]